MLEYFQDHRQATVMGMSRALDYPQSSTSELLRCLTRLGYLHYNRFRRTYTPTARVAMLGAWVEPDFFQRGPILSAMDEVSEATGETVMLSTATNYLLQHIHVVHGQSGQAVEAHIGESLPILHSAPGRLQLSSYRDEHIRSAVHRLNAEESDPERRLPLVSTVEELRGLRQKGWLVYANGDGTTSVSALVRAQRGRDRLVMSITALSHVVEARWEEFVNILVEKRDALVAVAPPEPVEPAPVRAPTRLIAFAGHPSLVNASPNYA
jgi:DNA-binding IclR family transcriptional regulator